MVATTQELSDDYPFNRDMNSGQSLGIGLYMSSSMVCNMDPDFQYAEIGWAQSATGNGMRSSASSSYIRPVLSRLNLFVLVNTVATKLLTSSNDTEAGIPVVSGVEVAQFSTCMHISRISIGVETD